MLIAAYKPERGSEEHALSELNGWLIEQHYAQMGCDGWDSHRVWRLCTKLQRTQIEMAFLLRITPADFRRKLRYGFSKQDGLILALLEAEIDVIRLGEPSNSGIFCFKDKEGCNGRS